MAIEIKKYVLSCDLGIIEFLSEEKRSQFIIDSNIQEYTMYEFTDNVSDETDINCDNV